MMMTKLVLLFSLVFVPSILCDSCFTSLFSNDPLFAGISLLDGSGSFQYKDNFVTNGPALPELVYLPNNFLITPSWFGSKKISSFASFTEAELINKFNITMTNVSSPLNSVYMTITYANSHFGIVHSFVNGSTNPVNITFSPPSLNGTEVLASVDTIYIINTTNPADSNDHRIVKLKVEEVTPQKVSFRWDVLQDGKGTVKCGINNNQATQSYDVIATYQGALPQLLNAPTWVIVAVAVLFVGFLITLILVIVLFVRVRRAGYEKMP